MCGGQSLDGDNRLTTQAIGSSDFRDDENLIQVWIKDEYS